MNEIAQPSATTDHRHETRATIRVLADVGFAGPLLFAVGVIVAGAATPGYSHLSEPISQLAEPARPYWLIQVAGFVVFGISMIVIAFALWQSLSAGSGAKLGVALVGFAGFNMVLTGLFRTDPISQEIPSVSGQIHETTAGLVFLSLIAGFLVLGRAMRRSRSWHGLASFSITAGLAALIFLIGFGISFEAQPEYVGVWQRLLATTIILWFVVISVRTKRLVPVHEGA